MDTPESKTSLVSARLVILIVLAGGLGLWFALRTSAPEIVVGGNLDDGAVKEYKPILQRILLGETPPEEAEFDIQIEIDTSTDKSKMVLYITEIHGFYVETLDVRFWWKGDDPELERDDATFSFVHHINNYIKANETYKECFIVSVPELTRVNQDIGTSENWGMRMDKYHRHRAQNPEKFPEVTTVGRECD